MSHDRCRGQCNICTQRHQVHNQSCRENEGRYPRSDEVSDVPGFTVINTKALLSVLSIIMNNLDKINGQNRFLRFFCREFNKAKIDDCLNRLESALERFSVSIRSSLI